MDALAVTPSPSRARRGSPLAALKIPAPTFIEPQKPKLAAALPTGGGWIHEIKFDGYRMQLRVVDGEASWRSSNGVDWTDRLRDMSVAAEGLPDCILDGELCALDGEGHPDFSRLRTLLGHRPRRSVARELTYFALDLLWLAGEDLTPFPLRERRSRLLHQVVGQFDDIRFRIPEQLPGEGKALLQAACGLNLEGIVSKRLDAPYRAGQRLDTWRKAKCRPGQELVIGGWRTEGARFRSLMTGVYEDGKLRYAGTVGSGVGGRALAELLPKLRALESDRSPFSAGAPPRKTTDIHWARPELVANVEIAEWTASGKIRQASYKGLRTDKAAAEVTRERV